MESDALVFGLSCRADSQPLMRSVPVLMCKVLLVIMHGGGVAMISCQSDETTRSKQTLLSNTIIRHRYRSILNFVNHALRDVPMAEAYDETDFGIDSHSFLRGRAGRRHGTGQTGWRGNGRGSERGNERVRGKGSGRGERGGQRGRGKTTGRGNGTNRIFSTPGGRNAPTRDYLEGQPMGDLLGTIALSELQSSVDFKDATLEITECQYLASYNWLDRQKATILVPG